MTDKMKKITRKYWNISKIAGLLFAILRYEIWTTPFNFAKAVALIIGGSVVTFSIINLLDMFIGFIRKSYKKIRRNFYDKRLLKEFCEQKEDEV